LIEGSLGDMAAASSEYNRDFFVFDLVDSGDCAEIGEVGEVGEVIKSAEVDGDIGEVASITIEGALDEVVLIVVMVTFEATEVVVTLEAEVEVELKVEVEIEGEIFDGDIVNEGDGAITAGFSDTIMELALEQDRNCSSDFWQRIGSVKLRSEFRLIWCKSFIIITCFKSPV